MESQAFFFYAYKLYCRVHSIFFCFFASCLLVLSLFFCLFIVRFDEWQIDRSGAEPKPNQNKATTFQIGFQKCVFSRFRKTDYLPFDDFNLIFVFVLFSFFFTLAVFFCIFILLDTRQSHHVHRMRACFLRYILPHIHHFHSLSFSLSFALSPYYFFFLFFRLFACPLCSNEWFNSLFWHLYFFCAVSTLSFIFIIDYYHFKNSISNACQTKFDGTAQRSVITYSIDSSDSGDGDKDDDDDEYRRQKWFVEMFTLVCWLMQFVFQSNRLNLPICLPQNC